MRESVCWVGCVNRFDCGLVRPANTCLFERLMVV